MKKLLSLAIQPVLLAGLLPLIGGCTIQGRARVFFPVPTATFVATASAPSTVIETTAPAAPEVTLAPNPPETVYTVGSVDPVEVETETRPPASVYTVGVIDPVVVTLAPPAPPPTAVTVTPAPRPGYVWVEGHYQWSGSRWVWTSGSWIRARADATWVPPRYEVSRRVWVRGHFEANRSEVERVRVPLPPRPPSVSVNIRAPQPPPPPRVSVNFHVGR